MRIIAAFAGTGKSFFCGKYAQAIDFAVMPFKYKNFYEVSGGLAAGESIKANRALEMRDGWQRLYHDAIVHTYQRYADEIIVIPTESLVLEMLDADGIPYVAVYPHAGLADEYEARYRARGNTEDFIDIFIGDWELWMEMVRRLGGEHIELKAGEYLSDVIQPRSGGSRIIADRECFLAQLARKMMKGDFEDEERRIRLG